MSPEQRLLGGESLNPVSRMVSFCSNEKNSNELSGLGSWK